MASQLLSCLHALIWKNHLLLYRRYFASFINLLLFGCYLGLALWIIFDKKDFNLKAESVRDVSDLRILMEKLDSFRGCNPRDFDGRPYVGISPREEGASFVSFMGSLIGKEEARQRFVALEDEYDADRAWKDNIKGLRRRDTAICGYIYFENSIMKSLNPTVFIKTFGGTNLFADHKYQYQIRGEAENIHKDDFSFLLHILTEKFMHDQQVHYCKASLVNTTYDSEHCGDFKNREVFKILDTKGNQTIDSKHNVLNASSTSYNQFFGSTIYVAPIPMANIQRMEPFLADVFTVLNFLISFVYFFAFYDSISKEMMGTQYEMMAMRGCNRRVYYSSWLLLFLPLWLLISVIIIIPMLFMSLIPPSSIPLILLISTLHIISLFAFLILSIEIIPLKTLGRYVVAAILSFAYVASTAMNEGSSHGLAVAVYLLPGTVYQKILSALYRMNGYSLLDSRYILDLELAHLTYGSAAIFITITAAVYLTCAVSFYWIYKKSQIRSTYKVDPHEMRYTKEGIQDVADTAFSSSKVITVFGGSGAGKSDTLKMLAAQIPLKSDELETLGSGPCMNEQLPAAVLSICPQVDALWDELTVGEQIRFYLMLQHHHNTTFESEEAMKNVLKELNLTPESRVSTVMKRRVSIAVAFLNDSKYVFLDEPTASLPIQEREAIWRALLILGANRTMCISTSSTMEAERMGGYMILMLGGSCIGFGKVAELQEKFNIGCTLKLVKVSQLFCNEVFEEIKRIIPNIKIGLDTHLECHINIQASHCKQLPAVIEYLEEAKKEQKIELFSLECARLDTLFCEAAARFERQVPIFKKYSLHHDILRDYDSNERVFCFEYTSIKGSKYLRSFKSALLKRFHFFQRIPKRPLIQILLPALAFVVLSLTSKYAVDSISSGAPLTLNTCMISPSHEGAALSNFIYIGDEKTKETKALVSQGIPELWRSISSIEWSDINKRFKENNRSKMNDDKSKERRKLEGVYNILMKQWTEDGLSTIGDTLYGGISIINRGPHWMVNKNATQEFVTIWYSEMAIHSLPILYNMLYKLIAIIEGRNVRSRVIFEPLTVPSDYSLSSNIIVFGCVLLFGIISTATAADVVLFEKTMKLRLQQSIAGTPSAIYWVANFTFDLLNVLTQFAVMVLMLFIIDKELLENAGTLTWIYTLFTVASIFSSYAMSHFAAKYEESRSTILSINLIAGSIGSIVGGLQFLFLFEEFTKSTVHALATASTVGSVLRWVGLSFPSFNFAYSCVVFGYATSINLMKNEDLNKFLWFDVYWRLIVCVAINFLLFLILEIFDMIWDKLMKAEGIKQEQMITVKADEIGEKDGDPLMVEQTEKTPLLQIEQLRKTYGRTLWNHTSTSIGDVTASLNGGECLALIGDQGTGKSTVMDMIVGWCAKSNGMVSIDGYSLEKSRREYLNRVGYSPQDNKLWGELTMMENLNIFAIIHGYEGRDVERSFDKQMEHLGINEYKDVKYKHLNKATQRKVSFLVALIGEKSLIVVDEPFTGLDPLSRRQMVELYHEYMKTMRFKCAAVISSDDVNDMGALANKAIILKEDGVGTCEALISLKDMKESFTIVVKFREVPREKLEAAVIHLRLEGVTEITYEEGREIYRGSSAFLLLPNIEADGEVSLFDIEWGMNAEEFNKEHISVLTFVRWLETAMSIKKLQRMLHSRGIDLLVKNSSRRCCKFISHVKPSTLTSIFNILGDDPAHHNMGYELESFTCVIAPINDR